MASVQFLEKRIEGKEKEIAKLQKKMARIEKAAASNWENNPYWYTENDLKYTARDIEEAQKALADYKAKLEAEQKKDASRNVQVIIDFLEVWKANAMTAYRDATPKYIEAEKKYEDQYRELSKQMFDRNASHEERLEKRKERNELTDAFNKMWGWVAEYVAGSILEEERLKKDLDREATRKYDFIIERTTAIVGEITDASNLEIADNGELNGYIIGTDGKATVKTIGAGGYNIQRFHFRTLVHEMK